MSILDSSSRLSRLKMMAGCNIDRSGTSSAFILESRVRKAVEQAYADDRLLHTRFAASLKRANLPRMSVIKRLEKLEAWQLRLVTAALEEQGVHEAIAAVFLIKKTERRKHAPPEDRYDHGRDEDADALSDTLEALDI